jgi:SRSO17 transposase
MDRRFILPSADDLSSCDVSSAFSRSLPKRFQERATPFGDLLDSDNDRYYFHAILEGLVTDGRKNLESIAYAHNHDRQMYQNFVGLKTWAYQPMLNLLAQQVGKQLGDENAVLGLDPTSFPKQGKKSVGVARQWCGRLGKVENCQVAVCMSLASEKGHALVNTRLYLPKEWTRFRQIAAGVPKEHLKFRTRHELALIMIKEQRADLPHGWIAGDDEFGRSSRFRKALNDIGERYFLAVPSNTLVRDLEVEIEYSGRGAPRKMPYESVAEWTQSQCECGWQRVVVREGSRGPLEVDVLICRVQAKTVSRVGLQERLVVIRYVNVDKIQHDYYLTNASDSVSAAEYARVSKLGHTIEDDFRDAKSQCGLADYQVRNWYGWHHHVTMSLIASWCLTQEVFCQKKAFQK